MKTNDGLIIIAEIGHDADLLARTLARLACPAPIIVEKQGPPLPPLEIKDIFRPQIPLEPLDGYLDKDPKHHTAFYEPLIKHRRRKR